MTVFLARSVQSENFSRQTVTNSNVNINLALITRDGRGPGSMAAWVRSSQSQNSIYLISPKFLLETSKTPTYAAMWHRRSISRYCLVSNPLKTSPSNFEMWRLPCLCMVGSNRQNVSGSISRMWPSISHSLSQPTSFKFSTIHSFH